MLNLLQVLFLDIAMPSGMTRDQIIKRYDDNCGFPTDQMVTEMKTACAKIESMKTYDDWFKVCKFGHYSLILITQEQTLARNLLYPFATFNPLRFVK